MVQRLASSCIQLIIPDPKGSSTKVRIASGVLIAPEVALVAAHTLQSGIAAGKMEVLMDFECDAATAPPGAKSDYKGFAFPSCTPLTTTSQAVDVKSLESDTPLSLDYAMVLIKWNSASPVKLPRIPVFPKPGYVFSKELLLIGHPQDKTQQGEPTQAAAFTLVRDKAPNPTNLRDAVSANAYGYGKFLFTDGEGLSGGGVFNDQGELVGLLKGNTENVPGGGNWIFCFLNLGMTEGITRGDPRRGRLNLWFTTGNNNPLKPGEGSSPAPTFTT
jgi:hypothetical protein